MGNARSIEAQLRRVRRDEELSCHQQIHGIVVRAVEAGHLAPGARLPAERRIADLAGVSRTTVRIAMAGLVHQGYVEKRTGSGVFVAPRLLRRGIGCALPAVNPYDRYPWRMLLAQSILREVRGRGHEDVVYLLGSDEDYAQLQRDADLGRIEGLLSVGRLQAVCAEIPVVYGNLRIDGHTVNIDYAAMVRQGVEYLAGHGCRELALFTYRDTTQRQTCRDAFGAALRDAGLPRRQGREVAVQEWGEGCNPEEEGRKGLLQMWRQRRHPDGIVFTDDWHGLGAMRALVELGVAVPDQVRLVTHANAGYELPRPCPAARLQLDPRDLARGMVDALEQIWTGDAAVPRQLLVAPQLLG